MALEMPYAVKRHVMIFLIFTEGLNFIEIIALQLKLERSMKKLVLNLHITPNSGKFEISGFDEWRNALKVRTRSKPIEGKANTELERELSRVLGAEVKIISGGKSRDKKALVIGNESK